MWYFFLWLWLYQYWCLIFLPVCVQVERNAPAGSHAQKSARSPQFVTRVKNWNWNWK